MKVRVLLDALFIVCVFQYYNLCISYELRGNPRLYTLSSRDYLPTRGYYRPNKKGIV